jgi:hypothetical protein
LWQRYVKVYNLVVHSPPGIVDCIVVDTTYSNEP